MSDEVETFAALTRQEETVEGIMAAAIALAEGRRGSMRRLDDVRACVRVALDVLAARGFTIVKR